MRKNSDAMVLVTGATGAVGPRVVQALHEAGYRIRTLSLDKLAGAQWPGDIDMQSGDVTDAGAVRAAMQGIDAVVHLAALLHIVNPPPALRARYEQINVGGTATVIQESLQAGVRRVVLFSTIAVYGPSEGNILNESSPPRPDTFYAQTKLAAEDIVLKARRADGKAMGTVLRMGAIYGARIKGNYRRLLQSLAHGRFVPLGEGNNRRTLVYDKDAARAAVLAVCHASAAGGVFNVSDGRFHPLKDIIAAMCRALGRRPPRWSLPVRPVRAAVGVLEDMLRCSGVRSPVGRSTIDKFTEDIAVEAERIQRELGFGPQYGLETGWKETVREMRETGDL